MESNTYMDKLAKYRAEKAGEQALRAQVEKQNSGKIAEMAGALACTILKARNYVHELYQPRSKEHFQASLSLSMYEFGLVVRDRTHKPLELCVTISDTSPNPPMYVALNVAASGGASLEEMVQLADTIKDMAALGQHLKTILAEVLPMFDPVFTAASANSPDYIILDAACRTATSMVAAHNRMYREYQP